ncbi:uncharacterized protein LOC134271902 [Saccostrea cucullata]|uniref:uncharacterized protein LOC134271902 n=1 Tax=Saccostrea cuccullata TaxID=36930 RepID=UPI002ED6B534
MTSGRRGTGYIVESLDGSTVLKLPTLVECSDIPNNRDEIPSPEVALQYQYLHDIAPFILPVNEDVEIELLIGRDLIMAHHVLDQRISVDHSPYAQRLPLGWVILGPVCLGNAHLTDSVNVKKTFILPNGRPSLLEPCESKLSLKEDPFLRTSQDEKLGLSIEDKAFLQIMDSGFKKDTDGHWTAPLPFREDRPRLPDNRDHALRRAKTLDLGLLRNPLKREHVQEFMRKIFDRGHAELAPHLPAGNERWYLPMFGVYHPKKPEAIRMVFDSSAKHEGVALNDVLLKGPDSSNSLQGILMRFRKDKIAITADVEQMFHNFRVCEPHRDYLRFIWHEENNVEKPLTDYRMTVHVFGNSPSPAVATYGLRKSVTNADDDVRSFVNRNFYVDDGLISCPSEIEAVNLFKRTQESLMSGGHLRLHKVASNSKAVLQMCDSDDLAKDLKDLDLGQDTLPVQRSLGVSWDIESDNIVFRVSTDQRPFTRRGVLSVINSLYDPLGFTAPVTLQGKLLLREMMSSFSGPLDWDEPLQPTFQRRWQDWVISLQQLELLKIPRMYCKLSVTFSSKCEVHICSDASKEAIAAVAYLKVFTESGSHDSGFLLGKGKVVPVHGHTIPRLELCAAVMAVDLAETINEQMDIDREAFHFYTDSRIVLGYISNDSRRFHVYVANRVGRIRSFSKPCQWNHIPTDCNPADLATREFHASDLPYSMWIHGPSFLKEDHVSDEDSENRSEGFPLIDTEEDKEVKKEDVMCMKTTVEQTLDWERFSRFSSWKHLVRAVMNVKRLARKYKKSKTEVSVSMAEIVIIRKVQSMIFPEEIAAITEGRSPPLPLKPILDEHGVLRVGGRIQRMRGKKQNDYTKAITCHPKIIPKGHQIALLLVRHYHASIHHQGRHLTEGAIRSAGYWIIGGKRLVSTVIRDCVTCKKLRGQTGWCQMADLPIDRMEPGPPFTFVGIDTFGPWPIVFRRTRGGQSNQNRWAIMFTCLVSRAVHVELVEELSSSSFINALRRFVAVRGPVKQYRSDRGTNFVGAAKELNIDAHFVESGEVGQYLAENGASWLFNPPHASHFGGAWERMIGACRKILDAMLLQNKHDLTHEVLSTLMLEVCAILNARPLVPVSSDPEEPEVLSPSLLLTQKPSSWDPQLPEFELKDALKSQWKFVQHLADEFWTRWSSDYLQNLQKRQKWESGGVTFSVGDIVLMKESVLSRNRWPLGIIEETFPSDDSFVRKVKVVVIRDGKRTPYVRPISQLIHLIEVK